MSGCSIVPASLVGWESVGPHKLLGLIDFHATRRPGRWATALLSSSWARYRRDNGDARHSDQRICHWHADSLTRRPRP